MGCGVVVVVVVWVDRHLWVAGFVGINGWLEWVSWWWVWVLPLINLRPTPPSTSNPRRRSECLLVDIGYLTRKPMEFADPPLLSTQLTDIVLVYDWWFYFLFFFYFYFFVIGDFVWSGLRKKIGDFGWWFYFFFNFFFLLWTGGSGDGGGGGGCDCGWW